MADLETLLLELTGTFTYPAGATGSLTSLGPQALISRIELVCDGKITVLSAPAWAFGVASDRTYEGSGGGANLVMTTPAANAAGTLSTQMYVDLMQFDGVRPKDSNLRVRGFSLVELRITFANWTACFTNAASVPTVFNVTLNVDANLCTESDPDNNKPLFVRKMSSMTIDASAAQTARQINLPAGNALRSIKFFTHVNGVASDNILTDVTVANGLDVRVQGSARSLRTRVRGYKSTQTGHNEIDFARQSRSGVLASNAWALPQPAQPVLTIGHAGVAGGVIEIVITEYVGA